MKSVFASPIITLALLLAVTSQTFLACQAESVGGIKELFIEANIPQDLGITFDPVFLLDIELPQPVGAAIEVKAGQQLTRNETAGPPTFSISSTKPTIRKYRPDAFVVIAVDPDAPTPQNPSSAQIRHFLGGTFHPVGPFGSFEAGTLRNRTSAVSEWRRPNPPAGSDAHRYVFLLYAQPAGFNTQTLVTTTTPIQLFDVAAFAEGVGLGDPLGGTFFRVAPDATPASL